MLRFTIVNTYMSTFGVPILNATMAATTYAVLLSFKRNNCMYGFFR
jgi:hypothetical protein